MEFVWDTGKHFWQSTCCARFITDTLSRIFHASNQSATDRIPVQRSTGRPVAKGEEQTVNTIPIPILARRPSTMNSFSPAMVDPQRLHGSELHFDKFPTLSTYSCWKIRFKNQVCSCSVFCPRRLCWSIQWMIFKSSPSIKGTEFPNFEMLDAKIAFFFEQDHPEFLLQEKGQSGGT